MVVENLVEFALWQVVLESVINIAELNDGSLYLENARIILPLGQRSGQIRISMVVTKVHKFGVACTETCGGEGAIPGSGSDGIPID